MSSPKIKADLIPMLYQIKPAQPGKAMTQIVDEIWRPAVRKRHEELVTYGKSKEGGNQAAV